MTATSTVDAYRVGGSIVDRIYKGVAQVWPYVDLSLGGLPATAYAAHRGGGLLAPEGTMEAFARAVSDGADVLEMDVWITSDNVLVVTHDGTDLSRTTDGTGSVASKTAAQIAALNVDSAAWFGSPYYGNLQIPTLTEVLDAHGGSVCMFVQAGSAAVYAPLIAEINARGLAESVVVQGETVADLNTAGVVAAGIPAAVVVQDNTEATGTASPANLTSAGIEYAMVNGHTGASVSDANVSAYVSAGIKVYMFDVVRQYRRDHYTALGVAGFITDDPLYLSGDTATYRRSSDSFADGTFGHGMLSNLIVEGAGDVTATSRGNFTGTDRWGFLTAGSTGQTRYSLLGELCPVADPTGTYQVTVSGQIEAVSSDTSRFVGVKFAALNDYPFADVNPVASGDEGYHVILRQNGQMALYKLVPGSNATQLGSTVTTAALTTGSTYTLQIDVTPTGVTVTRTDVAAPNSISSADTTYRGGYLYAGRSASVGQGPGFSIHDVAVS